MGRVGYIGVENEFISFEKEGFSEALERYRREGEDDVWGLGENAEGFFPELEKSFDKIYRIGETAIRTDTGHGFYVDVSEIEILTPPIAINRGFATRLTDSLMIGRNRLVDATPDELHTGYSMHWNVSSETYDTRINFANRLAVPFGLFGATPLSVGIAFRGKSESGRWEILGDSLTNEDQIKATALMLGAYSAASLDGHYPRFPLETQGCSGDYLIFGSISLKRLFSRTEDQTNSLGRYSDVNYINYSRGVSLEGVEVAGKIQAQQYLEMFYKWLWPQISRLGTKGEIRNLEDFIAGRKLLEADKFKYFSELKAQKLKKEGVYLPYETGQAGSPGTVLKKARDRPLPLENRLLGKFVSEDEERITLMEFRWGVVNMEVCDQELEELVGGEVLVRSDIGETYGVAEKLFNKGEKVQFKGPHVDKRYWIGENVLEGVQLGKRIVYSPDNEVFEMSDKGKEVFNEVVEVLVPDQNEGGKNE